MVRLQRARLIRAESNVQLKIANTIVTADLKQPVDIARFNEFAWGRFDLRGNYHGRVGYIKDPTMEGRVSVFNTGKMISTGGKSVEVGTAQLTKSTSLLAQNKFIQDIPIEPKIQNIVATLILKGRIDLNALSVALPRSVFEPGQFAGIIYKEGNGHATYLIFGTGKVVIVGAKSEEQLEASVGAIKGHLKPFLSSQ